MGEFDFIAAVKALFGPLGERIGDDCAVLPMGDGAAMVLTTDMLVEGEHFLREAASPREIGRKSLSVNLSDIAAMGARPTAAMLSIGLPEECTGAWAQEFMRGFHEVAGRFDVQLIGGDTTRARAIVINVVAIGRAPMAHIKRRSAAQAGDLVAVAGQLGDSAAGLAEVLAGNFSSPLARIHHDPQPQVEEGLWLGAQAEVHAMIDLSDGLASDLRHILTASGVGAQIDLERIPTNHPLEPAVTGGEDYKLLFTFADGLQLPEGMHVIGRIVAGDPRIEWREHGVAVERDWRGFTHW